MKRMWMLALSLALVLCGCAPTAREPDQLALVRVLGVAGAGPVELTASQRDVFRYFASSSQYDLRFVPEYADGVFSSWDDLLLWLYKGGISRGGIMAREQR